MEESNREEIKVGNAGKMWRDGSGGKDAYQKQH